MEKMLVFTDLDGTLLDAKNYSYDAAAPALRLIRDRRVSLVICSSKTRAEIEHYRKKLGNTDPFISENGGGVFVPKNYFSSNIAASPDAHTDAYAVFRLGASYKDLRRAVTELRREGFDIRGFGDMDENEVSRVTGLPANEAALAKMREFDEPFLFAGDTKKAERLEVAVKRKGFFLTRGLFHHILGDSDKGRAVSMVTEMFRQEYGDIVTVALGDSPNDLPMLLRVDHPVIVEKHGGGYDPCFAASDFIRAVGAGPAGWNTALTDMLNI